MQIGRVVGHAVSSVKHPSLTGWRLLLVQPVAADGGPDDEPILAIDPCGAGRSDRVVLSNDGSAARDLVGAKDSPLRWVVLGVCD